MSLEELTASRGARETGKRGHTEGQEEEGGRQRKNAREGEEERGREEERKRGRERERERGREEERKRGLERVRKRASGTLSYTLLFPH